MRKRGPFAASKISMRLPCPKTRAAIALLCVFIITITAFVLVARPAAAVTYLTVEGQTVVIHVPIEIRGLKGVKVKDAVTGETFDAATYMEREIERIWNDAFRGFSYECWRFRLDVEFFLIGWDSAPTKGRHLIEIDRKRDRSHWDVTGPDDMVPDRDFPFAYSRDMTGVFNTPDPAVLAHEIGHALGLGDDYFGKKAYKPEAGGIGERAGGVYFIDQDGDTVPPGSFMTRGIGGPEAVHLWRVVNMMKEAGVLPPCTRTYEYDVTFRSVLKNEGSGYVKTNIFCCGEREWAWEVTSIGRFPNVRVTVEPIAGGAKLAIRGDTPATSARVTGKWKWFKQYSKKLPVDVNCNGEMTRDVSVSMRMFAVMNANRTNNASSESAIQFSGASRIDLGANCKVRLPAYHLPHFTWNGLNVRNSVDYSNIHFEQQQDSELTSPASELLTGRAFTLDTGTHADQFSDCPRDSGSQGVECRSRIRSEQRSVVIFTPKQ